MYRTAIAVVDASRARLFTHGRATDPAGPHEELAEIISLVHPARRRRPSELFSDTRPGSSRAGGRGFAFDDHRQASLRHMDLEFAHSIGRLIDDLIDEAGIARLIVCASPRMLGAMREVLRPRHDVEVLELARDLVKLTPPQLHDELLARALLPPEHAPAAPPP